MTRGKKPRKILRYTADDPIAEHRLDSLEQDLNEIDKKTHFVSWGEAKQDLDL
jgi:hypothetical protein